MPLRHRAIQSRSRIRRRSSSVRPNWSTHRSSSWANSARWSSCFSEYAALLSRSPRRDCYLPCYFYVPAKLPVGDYVLTIQVTDLTGASGEEMPPQRSAATPTRRIP